MESSLLEQPIAALLARQESGELTAAQLVEASLARIAALDSELGAFVSVFDAEARSAAEQADRDRAAGASLGPLHGIPVAVKDLADIAGWPTGFGSRAYATGPAAGDAEIVRRLRRAGAIIVGKTQMVEFAFGSWGTNYSLGTPRNPRDRATARVPGGSSSGSAVAVAAGMVPAAIGSDTGGSVRIPAALCGLVGLKTTVGLLPMDGVAALSPTLDTLGPLVHCVEDAARLLSALLGATLSVPPLTPDQLTLGAVDGDQLEPLDAPVRRAYESTLERLRAAGCRLRPFRFPLHPVEMQAFSGRLMAYEAYGLLRHLVDDDSLPLDPHVRTRVLGGRGITAEAYEAVMHLRDEHCAAFAAAYAGLDGLVMPTVPLCATPIVEADESTIPMSRLTRAANYLDLSAITVPAGALAPGLPVGIQLIVPGGAEARALGLGRLVEELVGQV